MFQWFIISAMAVLHPFFVSVIEMNHNAKEKSVEVSIRIFTDDLEATLKKVNNSKVDLLNPNNKVNNDKLIVEYIRQKMAIKIDTKLVVLEYVGYEIKKESVWIYFEIDNIASIKKVDVNCNLLYDFEKKQINIFNVKANGKEESYKLDYPKTDASFNL